MALHDSRLVPKQVRMFEHVDMLVLVDVDGFSNQ